MIRAVRRAAALAVAALLAAPPALFGQPPPGYPTTPPAGPELRMRPPGSVAQPPSQFGGGAGVGLPPAAAAAPNPTMYPPSYYSSYGYPYYPGSVGGALTGAANFVNATGQYYNSVQQARVTQTQADMSRIDYRRALEDERRYEQSIRPTALEVRQKQQWDQLQTARNNPPEATINSGQSLNALLQALQTGLNVGLRADPVPLSPDVLAHINLTGNAGGAGAAGAGMLKNLTNLQWPFALQDDPFNAGRTEIDDLAKKAVEQVTASGRVEPATFRGLNTAVASLDSAVHNNQSLSPTDWIESTSFLDNLQSSIQTLRSQNAGNYFNGNYTAKGATVADLVANMSARGLQFAPAAPGDEPSYKVLQQAMASYDYRLAQLASR